MSPAGTRLSMVFLAVAVVWLLASPALCILLLAVGFLPLLFSLVGLLRGLRDLLYSSFPSKTETE